MFKDTQEVTELGFKPLGLVSEPTCLGLDKDLVGSPGYGWESEREEEESQYLRGSPLQTTGGSGLPQTV